MGDSNAAYRADIDGLRAVAVSAVVLGHAGVPGFGGGHVGVDVFFVISGFLITRIVAGEADAGAFSLARFYERRLRRIAPALLAMLAVCTVLAWALLLPGELRAYDYNLRGALGFAANLTHWDTLGYFDPGAASQPLLHTWSLAVEEQFYLVAPLALVWVGQGGRLRLVWGVVAVSLTLALAQTWVDPQGAFYLPHTRAWELGVGALLALGALPAKAPAWAPGLGLGLIGWAVWGSGLPFPGLGALPPVIGAALVIWGGGGRLLGALAGLGRISYSLYLWHWPVLVFWPLAQGGPLVPWQTGLAVAGSVALAWGSWAWIEQPVRIGAQAPGRRALLRGCGAAALGLVAVSLAGDWTDGAPGRFRGAAAQALAAQMAWEQSPARACLRRGAAMAEGADPGAVACRIGEGPVTFVLWGDSHAAALQPGLAAAAGRGGLALTMTACWPGSRGIGARAAGCTAFNTKARAWLLAQPPLDVILTASWAVAPGDLAGPLAALVADLARHGHRVSLVAGLALPGVDLPGAAARRAMRGAPPPPMPGAADLARIDRAEARVLGRIAPADLAHRVRLADALCPQGACALIRGGMPLFADAEHLSPAGAMVVAPLLAPIFAP